MASYYHPYDSDESAESDITDDSEDAEDRRLQDPRYAILRAAGPALTTATDQQKYMNGPAVGAPWDESTNIKSLKDHVYLDPPKSTKTSLISIKSSDRDHTVWPTPFRFQLKLPRTYKDVTKFQLVQMSFPNNASNVKPIDLFTSSLVSSLLVKGVPLECMADCVGLLDCSLGAASIALVEQGRINAMGTPFITTVTPQNSSLTDPQLASELTMVANSTPPLNLVTLSTFQDVFQNTGDASLLFNEPGDTYVSPLLNQRYTSHTKETIMNTYYSQQHIDALGTISEDAAYIAYYFPILKEAVGTRRWKPFFSTCGLTDDEFTMSVLGPFQGLNSPVYSTLCHVNQVALDSYRPYLTFQMRPINSYKWAYQGKDKRFVTLHDTLHTSLTRDMNKQYSTIWTQHLADCSLNANSFKTLKTNGMAYQCIYKHMERNLSTVLGESQFVSSFQYHEGQDDMLREYAEDGDMSELFRYTSTFGRIFGNYAGQSLTFGGLADYHSTLRGYYRMSQSTTATLSSIQGCIMENYHQYVASKYGAILPSSMIQSRSYLSGQGIPVSFVNQNLYIPGMAPNSVEPQLVDLQSAPLPVETIGTDASTGNEVGGYRTVNSTIPSERITCSTICCYVLTNMVNSWYSCIPVNTIINSMAYRTGILNMTPNPFQIFSTLFQVANTDNKNFLMQINDEQGFNNMDVSMPENYGRSNETTGQVKLIAGKILMGAIGDTGVSQTVIQNPTVFENTLGKLDRLDIKIYYDDESMTPAWLYLPIFLSISEWNATFQIDEQIGFTNQHSGWGYRPSVPVPENPDSTPYLHFTHKDNPNNS